MSLAESRLPNTVGILALCRPHGPVSMETVLLFAARAPVDWPTRE